MAEDLATRYQRSLDRRLAGLNKTADQQRADKLLRGKTREEKERFAREQAAQARRDARLNQYDVQGTNQRAGIAADAAYNQHGYTLQRDKQQTIDQLKRDAAQQGYTLQRDDRQFGQQMQRDAVQQDYTLNRDDRQQGNLLQRDAIQQGYGVENDERRFGQQVQRDVMQDQFTTKRDRSQQQDLLQRDQLQFGQQTFRDRQQNDYQAQRDERLQGFSEQDAKRAFGYQEQRDDRLQGFDQQNAVQRETADIRSRWMDQVMQQRNNGFEFSQKQQHEMKQMEEMLLRQVLNNPNLDEGLKQDAMRQHQMKLAGFIPNEKVVTRDQEIEQTFYEHPTLGVLKRGFDSQGRPDWMPLGSSGGPKQEDPEKKAVEMQKKAFQREDELDKIRAAVEADNLDPVTETLKYKDEDAIDKEVMRRFAGKEILYNEAGLPPHPIFQHAAQREQQKESQRKQTAQEVQQRGGMANSLAIRSGDPRANPQSQMPPQAQPQAGPPIESDAARAQQELQQMQEQMRQPTSPPAKPKPVTVSSTNIDDQLKKSLDGGDTESADALQAIKLITERHGGAPPEGTQDAYILIEAIRRLEPKGISIDGGKQPPKPNMFESPRRF